MIMIRFKDKDGREITTKAMVVQIDLVNGSMLLRHDALALPNPLEARLDEKLVLEDA